MPFRFQQGNIKDIFVTEEEFIDRFTGQELFLWGTNTYGRLGDNTIVAKDSPVQTISGGNNWKQVSIGWNHSSAIKTDGSLWNWGYNGGGLLGINITYGSTSSPVQTISGGNNWKQVSAGWTATAAIKTDGTLWLWGGGSSISFRCGQLGNNSTAITGSPIQTISGGNNWKQVSLGQFHSTAIKTDGTLWAWGHNSGGTIGDNTQVNRSSPVQTVSGGTNWKQVSAGSSHTGAIKTDGTLWLWGGGYCGQLGTNDIANRSSPVQTVSGGNSWKQVSLGQTSTAAIKTDGTLWLWGRNGHGQLGDNTIVDRSSPVQAVTSGTNWRQVSIAMYNSSAIKTDGSLWSWGRDDLGQLGNNISSGAVSSPVQTVTRGTSWREISQGRFHTSATRIIE